MFTLTIETGNAAMDSLDDVAYAVDEIARRLKSGETEGSVRDLNGNTVGSFALKPDGDA